MGRNRREQVKKEETEIKLVASGEQLIAIVHYTVEPIPKC